ncbi:hypothetical protein [Kineothrix sp. MB12-C1]|uniref:hypothetical protein n=1 Tax=Kineothrix sp. MB12-C1 TaxID=3070215 RepID=UPI0027D31440|nr:hypothetical protein [Kineothrix sp. MB12-C1]WMC92483.1 hypothetical protein RBB56_16845 [Kineothrix sp. MB12-C1]
MKFVKRISLFFIIPMGMYTFGFYSHMKLQEEFYPGKYREESVKQKSALVQEQPQVIPTSFEEEQVINADTQYVIEEVDLKKETSVETKWKVPEKYIGMNRDRFVREMELYQQSPSLADQELGFVSVEVVSFSRDKVRIRKSYIFRELSTSFYLVNEKNFVVVYCDDLKTIYMGTNISIDTLPDGLKQEVIQRKYIASEEELYNFLESYSS